MITIQDNGPGIPAEERTRIFEPLFSTKAKGTGLGLTICRQIVAKHGGTIDLVDSTHGAVFRIVLPRYDDGQEA
jgi:signal transduction histidine kinase